MATLDMYIEPTLAELQRREDGARIEGPGPSTAAVGKALESITGQICDYPLKFLIDDLQSGALLPAVTSKEGIADLATGAFS